MRAQRVQIVRDRWRLYFVSKYPAGRHATVCSKHGPHSAGELWAAAIAPPVEVGAPHCYPPPVPGRSLARWRDRPEIGEKKKTCKSVSPSLILRAFASWASPPSHPLPSPYASLASPLIPSRPVLSPPLLSYPLPSPLPPPCHSQSCSPYSNAAEDGHRGLLHEEEAGAGLRRGRCRRPSAVQGEM